MLQARTRKRFGDVIDIRDFASNKGDGSNDDSVAVNQAIAEAPNIDTSWNSLARPAKATTIRLPAPAVAYRWESQVQIPGSKAIRLEGPPHGARIYWTGAGNYALRIRKDVGWSPRGTEVSGFVFDRGGITFDQQQIIHHSIERCIFESTPGPAITTSGISVQSVLVDQCFFSRCAGGIHLPYNSCDLWLVRHCGFNRGTDSDIYLNTSGVVVDDCDFETRAVANYDKPNIHITSSGSKIIRNRFADDTVTGYASPECNIVMGPLSGTSDTAIEHTTVQNNLFAGSNATLSDTNARHVLRHSAPLRNVVVSANDISAKYYAALVDELYIRSGANRAANHDNNIWSANAVDHTHTGEIFSDGGTGWIVSGGTPVVTRLPGPPLAPTNRVNNPTDLNGANWAVTNVSSRVKNVVGPDGVADSAYTLTKSSGSSNLRSAANAASASGDTWHWGFWLKAGTLDRARLAINGGGSVWWTSTVHTLRLDNEWRWYHVTAYRTPGSVTPALYLFLGGPTDDSTTGTVLAAFPLAKKGGGDCPPYLP